MRKLARRKLVRNGDSRSLALRCRARLKQEAESPVWLLPWLEDGAKESLSLLRFVSAPGSRSLNSAQFFFLS